MRSPSKMFGILAFLCLGVAVSSLRSAEEKKDEAKGGAAKGPWGDIKGQVVWGDKVPEDDVLRVHMHALRAVLDRPFRKKLLHTVHGVGYKLGE